MSRVITSVAGLFLLAACTQPAAQVVLQDSGQTNKFSRLSPASNGPVPSMYTSSTPRNNGIRYDDATVQAAPVAALGGTSSTAPLGSGISSSDLPSPTAAPMASPIPKTKPVELRKSDQRSDAGGKGYIWPVEGKLLSKFGPKAGGKVNDGINIAAAEGEPVYASASGEVGYVGNDLKGYGNMVIIKHEDGKNTVYAHLNRSTVMRADRVKQGDMIGYVGSTGNVKDPQLHFAMRDGNKPVDPGKFLSSKIAGLR